MAVAGAIPKVAEVLKGSFDESLKKLVQPASIVPAAILVLILLITAYPALLADGNRVAKAFEALDDVWKAAVATGFVIVLGYLLLSLNSTILRAATGESWRDTWLARRLIERNQSKLADLYLQASAAQSAGQTALASRLWSDAAATPDDVMTAPTRLGQVLNGMSGSVGRRYGIDPSGLWPHMRTVVAEKDEHLSAQLDDESVQLQVLLNLAAVLAIGATLLGGFYLLRVDWTAVLWSSLLFVGAYLLYSAAVPAARQYADTVEAIFDLYRGDLAKLLGVTVATDPDEAKATWRSVSASLLFDDEEAAAALAEDEEKKDPMTVKASSNVVATLMATPMDKRGPTIVPDGASIEWVAGYTLIVTSNRTVASSAVVAVLDRRKREVDDVDPAPFGPSFVPQPLPAGDDGAGVLWALPNLGPGVARSLRYDYAVGRIVVAISGACQLVGVSGDLDDPGPGKLVLELERKTAGETLVMVAGSRFKPDDTWTILVTADENPLAVATATVAENGVAGVILSATADISLTWFKVDH